MLTNAAKQARHRYYKKRAIRWYEKATGFKLKEVMDIMKFHDMAISKGGRCAEKEDVSKEEPQGVS